MGMFPLGRFIFTQTRGFRSSVRRLIDEKTIEAKVAKLDQLKAGKVEEHGRFPEMPMYKPNKFDRLCLVWSGHYKSLADVPPTVRNETIHKAKTWARIRINVYMLLIGVGICAGMAFLGKSDAAKGITVEGQNLDWHRKLNEQHKKQVVYKGASGSE